jgi:hypothetical protein
MTGFVDENELARATVVANSCVSDDGFFRTQIYYRSVQDVLFPEAARLIKCLAAVTGGCTAARRDCFGISPLQGGETCDTCNGDVAVYCGTDGPFLWDCSKLGQLPNHRPRIWDKSNGNEWVSAAIGVCHVSGRRPSGGLAGADSRPI